jgi:hypothetical protein
LQGIAENLHLQIIPGSHFGQKAMWHNAGSGTYGCDCGFAALVENPADRLGISDISIDGVGYQGPEQKSGKEDVPLLRSRTRAIYGYRSNR